MLGIDPTEEPQGNQKEDDEEGDVERHFGWERGLEGMPVSAAPSKRGSPYQGSQEEPPSDPLHMQQGCRGIGGGTEHGQGLEDDADLKKGLYRP